jgi:Zn ribbon nucleic-acid-binding protein
VHPASGLPTGPLWLVTLDLVAATSLGVAVVHGPAFADLDGRRELTVTGEECPACSGRDVLSHEGREPSHGVLFWSCADCGFTWPRFTHPVSDELVQESIDAAEQYEAHSRRSDR